MSYNLDKLPSCNLCPELVKNRTNVVIGAGSDKPKVVFVGEAPGKNEDLEAKPFIGKSGQILRETLGYIGFSEDEYYITNIVKCRPPGNRDPTFSEAKECFPYLGLQLTKLSPQVICSLGAHSTKYLISHGNFNNIDNRGISNQRGKFAGVVVEGKHYTLFPTYHPAATIYNRKLKDTFVDDLKRLKEYLNRPKSDLSRWI